MRVFLNTSPGHRLNARPCLAPFGHQGVGRLHGALQLPAVCPVSLHGGAQE